MHILTAISLFILENIFKCVLAMLICKTWGDTLNIYMQHVVKDFLAKDATSPVLLVDLGPVVEADAHQNVQNPSATLSRDANTII